MAARENGRDRNIQSATGIHVHRVTHQPRRTRYSVLKLLLLVVFIICAIIVVLAHVHVAGKMRAIDAKSVSSSTAKNQQGTLMREKQALRKRSGHQSRVNYHTLFSTTCSDQQDWESYVFFYHSWKVKQPGTVTRLASGCSKEQARTLTEFHATHIQTMSDTFHLHLTPDYSRIRLDKGRFGYKYMNKPFSVLDWMEHVLGLNHTTSQPVPPEIENDIIILMDPDMILLRPMTHDFRNEPVIWAKEPATPEDKIVKHGNPMSQQDGYLNSNWMAFNMTYITQDPDTPARLLTQNQGPINYNSGPPYLATVKDMFAIASKWIEFAPRVFDIHPKLFAEMFGYCVASAHLKLPHTMIKSIVVSTTETQREGWPLIDALPDDQICDPPSDAATPFWLALL